jgi:hypothetical protein
MVTGVPWLDEDDRIDGLPVDELCRGFGVDRIAEQPIWLNTQRVSESMIVRWR